MKIKKVGTINNNRVSRCDDNWGDILSVITLCNITYDDSATLGLQEFSHIEVIFYINQVHEKKIISSTRHPRNDINLPKVGILAQRGKNRPNTIGASFAEIVSIDGLKITVKGLDAIDNSPVIDIKPCVREFLPRKSISQPLWISAIMENYW